MFLITPFHLLSICKTVLTFHSLSLGTRYRISCSRLGSKREQLFEQGNKLQSRLVKHTPLDYITVEPRFNEVAGDRPNLFVKWRVRYIEVLFHTFYCNFGLDIEIISFVIKDFVK